MGIKLQCYLRDRFSGIYNKNKNKTKPLLLKFIEMGKIYSQDERQLIKKLEYNGLIKRLDRELEEYNKQ